MASFGGALVLTMGMSGVASAEISSGGTPTAGVYVEATGTQTNRVSNLVYDIEQIGNTIYVSGKFLETRPTSSGPVTSQGYIAAFDATTGAHIGGFQPLVEGPVYAIQGSPDGSRLIIGGEFISVAGDTNARGLAAIDPVTGALDTSWQARLTTDSGARPIVFDLALTANGLYAGGRFDSVEGSDPGIHRSQRVVKLDAADGSPDTTFALTSTGGSVRSLAVAPDGSNLYVGGNHTSVHGLASSGYFTVLDPATGTYRPDVLDWDAHELASWFPNVYAVAAVNNLVFFAGANNMVLVYDVDTGLEIARHKTDGDTQRLSVVGDRVYSGGHFYEFHIDQDGNQTDHTRVVAYSATTGDFIPTFNPSLSARRSGVWAIHGAADGCLWIGGDLTSMTLAGGGTRSLGGFAKFCDGEVDPEPSPEPGPDVTPPSAPTTLVQTRSEDHKIVIKYSAATDAEGVAHYEVRRDGVLIDTEPGGSSNEWFVDAGLASGTTYHYEVVAVDAAGNVGPAASLDAVTSGEGPVDPGDPVGLPAPANLRSTLQTRERIVLNWGAVPGAASYVIQLDSGVGFADIGDKTGRWFTHRNLTADTSYIYRVMAVDGNGERGTPSVVLTVATKP